MKVERTYAQLFALDVVSANYRKNNPDNKITACLTNFNKQLKKHFEEYFDEQDNLQINNCLTDEKTKAIIYVDKERQFSQDGERKLKQDIKELKKKKVFIHSRIAEDVSDLINKLTEEEKEVFSEIVISKQELHQDED